MPTTAELALILRFRDEASAALKASVQGIQGTFGQLAAGVRSAVQGVGAGIQTIGQGFHDFGIAVRATSRELTTMGTVIVGAFAIAFKNAAEYVPAVRDHLRSLSDAAVKFQIIIATAALPVLNNLTKVMNALKDALQNMDAPTRDFLIRVVLMGGVLSLVSGLLLRVVADIALLVGRTLEAVGAFIVLHPWLALIALVVGTLITVFGGWENTILKTARAVDLSVEAFQLLVTLFKAGLLVAIDLVVMGLIKFYDTLGHLPGQLGRNYREAADAVRGFHQTLTAKIVDLGDAADANIKKLEATWTHGGGVVEEGAKHAISAVKAVATAMRDGKDQAASFSTDMFNQVAKFWNSFTDISTKMASIITGGIASLESNFTSLFKGMIDGTVKAKDFFKEFAKSVLEAIASMIAKFFAFIAAVGVIAAILAPFGVGPGSVFKAAFKFIGAFHQGGYVGGLPKYHAGGEVLAALQPGEFVVNKEATSKNRGLLEQINNGTGSKQPGMVIVNNWNINATDAQSFRNQMSQHNDLVEAMFQRAIKRNSGAMRQSVRT